MMNLKYTHYTAEEFADDKEFWLWVLEEDAAQDVFWNNFLREHPGKAKEVERARQMVLQVNNRELKLEEKKVDALWERIKHSKDSLDAAASNAPFTECIKANC
ncbi:hypothetical protein GCM10027443_08840 [Pontibacter brevis]